MRNSSIFLATTMLATGVPAAAQSTGDVTPAEQEQTEAAPVGAAPVTAQEQDIIVTAHKREETLLEVPVAATAVSGELIERRGLASLRDVATLTPGLNINGDAAGRAFVPIRDAGITLVESVQPGLGVFLDGVYQPNTAYLNNPLVDVQRVEKLRGPQGTLYGKNTLGGANSVITRQPGNEFEVRGGGSYAGPDNEWNAFDSVSGPLVQDKLQARIAYSHRQQDGLFNPVLAGVRREQVNEHLRDRGLFFPIDPGANATIGGAVDTVVQSIQLGIPPARVEILDDMQIRAVNRWSKLDLPELTTLFFEFHGSERYVAEQIETVAALAADNGGGEFRWASRTEERNALWKARHEAYYAAVNLRPGAIGWATDVCVPLSRLAECIAETKQELEQSRVPATILGHVGDGNFHVVFSIDPNAPAELEEVQAINARMVRRALAMDGTCTGEHGIGLGKQEWLIEELGEAVGLMRSIKRALDPGDILNPGKVFAL